jgi:hypothetical protein
MLKLSAEVQDIDYSTLVNMIMPSHRQGKPNRFTRFLVSTIPKKTELAVWILPRFNEILKEYINNLLEKYQVAALVKGLKAETVERGYKKMLRVEFIIDEVDYEKTVDGLLPIVLQQLAEKEDESSKLPKILLKLKKLPRQVLGAAVRAIPKEQRDEVTALFLNEYKEELADTLNSILLQNSIKAEIKNIKVEAAGGSVLSNQREKSGDNFGIN